MNAPANISCPVCGALMSKCSLYAHVGSARCLQAWQYNRGGAYFDKELGPRAMALSRELAAVLGVVPPTPTLAEAEGR